MGVRVEEEAPIINKSIYESTLIHNHHSGCKTRDRVVFLPDVQRNPQSPKATGWSFVSMH